MRTSKPHRGFTRETYVKYLAAAGSGLAASCVHGQQQADPAPTQPPASPLASPVPPTQSIPATPTMQATDAFLPILTVPPSDTPAPTATAVPSATPTAADKIKAVIFFIQENHTFDSLFAGFPGADSMNAGKTC